MSITRCSTWSTTNRFSSTGTDDSRGGADDRGRSQDAAPGVRRAGLGARVTPHAFRHKAAAALYAASDFNAEMVGPGVRLGQPGNGH